MVSSVDTVKKATQLNVGRAAISADTPLKIHIQVNTSSEASKSGTSPGTDTTNLALHILKTCPHLHLSGLMTIGAIGRSAAVAHGGESYNPDFRVLQEERDRLENSLRNENDAEEWQSRWGAEIHVEENENVKQNHQYKRLEMSMGMSDDFELAIEMGSNEVRVGSTIFGPRS